MITRINAFTKKLVLNQIVDTTEGRNENVTKTTLNPSCHGRLLIHVPPK
jgi:hypothetical protein